jgi:hypothetical protein
MANMASWPCSQQDGRPPEPCLVQVNNAAGPPAVQHLQPAPYAAPPVVIRSTFPAAAASAATASSAGGTNVESLAALSSRIDASGAHARAAAATRGSSATGGSGIARNLDVAPAVEALEDALDRVHAAGAPFLGRYDLLGGVDRRAGGQGVVQFATQPRLTKQFALKVRGAPVQLCFVALAAAAHTHCAVVSVPLVRAVNVCLQARTAP